MQCLHDDNGYFVNEEALSGMPRIFGHQAPLSAFGSAAPAVDGAKRRAVETTSLLFPERGIEASRE